jgi:hypothetical protein
MRRLTQLFLVVLVLMTANLAVASQKGHKAHKGGHLLPTKSAGGGWFVCNSDPDTVHNCGDISSCACKAACEIDCDGPCAWDGTCGAT